MSVLASLVDALQAADEALLAALRKGDLEAASTWAETRESLIQRLASRVDEEPAGVRKAADGARAAVLELSRTAECERDRLSRELEVVRLARSRLARTAGRRPGEPRFVSRRT